MASNKLSKNMFNGKFPPFEGWEIAGMLQGVNGADWIVSVYEPSMEKTWRDVKIHARQKAYKKANYVLRWNGERFSKSKDSFLLESHRRELRDLALSTLDRFASICE